MVRHEAIIMIPPFAQVELVLSSQYLWIKSSQKMYTRKQGYLLSSDGFHTSKNVGII